MKNGFDNDKYLKMQSEKIRERIGQFGGKLYLEFGGKLFDDYHASRVLPGFHPDSKITMLKELRDQVERAAKSIGRKAGSAAVAKNVQPVVEKTLGEMKLSEIPEETILRGQAIVDEILTRPIRSKK